MLGGWQGVCTEGISELPMATWAGLKTMAEGDDRPGLGWVLGAQDLGATTSAATALPPGPSLPWAVVLLGALWPSC